MSETPFLKNSDSSNNTTWVDPASMLYHLRQWDTPKQSTKAFEAFVSDHLSKAKSIVDLGCGAGAATAYLARKNSSASFTGVDDSNELISVAAKMAQEQQIDNLSFRQGDMFNLLPQNGVDGVISLQTLSWLSEYEAPFLEIFWKISPQWIALTSLFYEGDITAWIQIEEHQKDNRKVPYNVYSIPAIKRLCNKHGYEISKFDRFEIDIDIDKPTELDAMGTYTRRAYIAHSSTHERLQMSGPLLLNWYMLLIEKTIR